MKQIEQWFINARRRLVPTLQEFRKVTKLPTSDPPKPEDVTFLELSDDLLQSLQLPTTFEQQEEQLHSELQELFDNGNELLSTVDLPQELLEEMNFSLEETENL